MRHRSGPILMGLLVLSLIAAPVFGLGGDEEQKQSASLKYKAYPKWTFVLPAEKFTAVGGSITIPHAGGEGFAATIDGQALHVDSNGDGKPDVKAKGTAGMVVLKGKTAEGAKFKYAVRLKNEAGWKFAAGGAMVGKVSGVPVTLIDQNNNGSYNDFGEDAMIVGKSKAASYLSKVVAIKGQLMTIDVTKSGREITYEPFVGEKGLINLRSGFKVKGKLASAVIRSEDGDMSFELSGAKKGLMVPVGTYDIVAGVVTKGTEKVKIRKGFSKPVRVDSSDPSVFAWGAPLKAEFTYDRVGDQVTFSPQNIWFYGKGGEEYYDWFPDGKPPKFIIKNSKTGREIASAKFGGC